MHFTDPQAALNHAMELHRQGRTAEADALYRQLRAHHPQATDLIHLIGLTTFELGRHDEGVALLQESLRQRPQVAHYHANYGVKLIDIRRTDDAIAALERAAELDPSTAGHRYNLGNALFQGQKWREAIDAYRQALGIDPRHQMAALQLGMALHSAGQTEEGITHYRRELLARPDDYAIATNLGALYQAQCDIDAAIEVFNQALAINPTNFFALNNLGIMLKERGEVAAALVLLKRCAEISPGSPEVRSNIILTMYYDPATSDAELAEQHREWDRRHGSPASGKRSRHANNPDPGRRLRIGYVSADFRDHVVGRALLPAFRQHDHEAFEITCYSLCPAQAMTEEFKSRADRWRDMAGTSDAEFVRQVQADEIDILIDLGLHTSDNRLTAFAQKPAPIQASWLGCPESSGLEAMDYRISDRYLEPPSGNRLADPNEKPCQLPDSWTCYEAPAGYPEVNGLPALRDGKVTFGSFNNSCKISDEVLATWSRILRATPGSRLMLLAKQGGHRRRMREVMESHGITADRLLFADYFPATDNLDQGRLLTRYHQVDIALDTFPYNGMTTTLDALWMGVPVVSLVGRRNLGRAGLSLLSTVGLPGFAAESVDAYVDLATKAAQDLDNLAALRSGLRAKMQASALLDAAGFTRKLEAGLRDMWIEWCEE